MTKKVIILLIAIANLTLGCKKDETANENSHPYAGTVRLYETKRNWKLKYHYNGSIAHFSVSIGTEELIELLPGAQKNQYYIRPKDHNEYCLDAQAKDDLFIKLYSYFGNNSQLFTITNIGDNKVRIQSVADTSLYLLNNSDYASFSYSSYLKPRSYDTNALDFWIIEKL
ncbi:MAG TPA: hypothetical protein PKO18_01120 [Chitinophagales bacterium]|nr:hypothetical protein [Chitinophagales bacterium]HNL83803.1 hypothetical protein [Chitinophagales bacterium]